MFLKQYAYKPRTNSGSSGTSGQAAADLAGSPPKDEPKRVSMDNVSAAAAGRRRSSASGGAQFAGLNAFKRGSIDEHGEAKKASFAEQKPGSESIIGGMWNSFTKGTGNSTGGGS